MAWAKSKTLSPNQSKMGWRCGSSGEMLAYKIFKNRSKR
jgi:hypothetical protein